MYLSAPRHCTLRGCLWALLVALALHVPALQSQTPAPGTRAVARVNGRDAVGGEVLVQFAASEPAERHRAFTAQIEADESAPVGRHGLRRFRSRTFDVETLMSFFRSQPGIVFVEPNYIVRAVALPNDPGFPSLWGLRNTGQPVQGTFGTAGSDIDAEAAWDVSTGSRANVIAIIDSGIDYTHPDLAANMWSAPAAFTVTIGGVPITCPAGSHGFNAINRTCDPMDDNNHGTHVAGTIGGVGNNAVGVTGVNWTASMIGAKFLNASGSGSTAGAIDAIDFLIQAKAAFAGTGGANVRVLNNSWGGGGFSVALQNAIADANTNNMLFVAAAGNSTNDNDVSPFYPAGYTLPNVVSVAATDSNDLRAGFSNFGASTVHLAAPGVNIRSTTIGNTYSHFSGTSMAAPHVAGAAALVLSACTLDTAALKTSLLSNVDVVGALTGLVITGGRLNVDRSIRSCSGTPSIPPAPTGVSASTSDGRVDLSWSPAPGAATYRVKRALVSGGPYATIAAGVIPSAFEDSGLSNGSTYFYVVSAVNAVGEGANSAEVSGTPVLAKPPPPQKLKATPGDARVSLSWVPAIGATSYRLKRSLLNAGPYALVTEVPGAAAVDLTVVNGVKYFYLVTAVNGGGESKASNKVSAVPAPLPSPPAGASAVTGANAGEVVVGWNGSAWATSYKVERSTVSGGPYTVVKKVTSLTLTDTGRTTGRRYYYVITALNSSGESGPSAEVSALAR